MSAIKWQSIGLYEHPAKHNAGIYGSIIQSEAGIYALKVGGSRMSCPQDWAAKIHHDETEVDNKTMILRNVPEILHRALKAKAAQEGKSLQALTIEILTAAIARQK